MSKSINRINEQMELYHSGDPKKEMEAKEQILNDHTRLITSIIKKHYNSYAHMWYEDLMQAGKLGLLMALETYDPEKSRPSTYFTFYIKHEIQDFISRYVNGVSIHYTARMTAVVKAQKEFENEGNFNPSDVDLSIRTGLPVEAVKQAKEFKIKSQPNTFDGYDYFDSMTQQYTESPEAILIDFETKNDLMSALNDLPEQLKRILDAKMGLTTGHPQTNNAIARKYGVPVNTIRNHISLAVRLLFGSRKLKDFHNNNADFKYNAETTEISVTPIDEMIAEMQYLEDDDLDEMENV